MAWSSTTTMKLVAAEAGRDSDYTGFSFGLGTLISF